MAEIYKKLHVSLAVLTFGGPLVAPKNCHETVNNRAKRMTYLASFQEKPSNRDEYPLDHDDVAGPLNDSSLSTSSDKWSSSRVAVESSFPCSWKSTKKKREQDRVKQTRNRTDQNVREEKWHHAGKKKEEHKGTRPGLSTRHATLALVRKAS